MTPVEELREAARLMRERAEAVYPSDRPWHELAMAHSGTALVHTLGWTPEVALAVADWLDSEANSLGAYYGAGENPAVKVAHAYLGGAA